MSIDKIGQYGGFYDRYRMPQISQVSVEEVKKQDKELRRSEMQQGMETLQIDKPQETFVQAPRMANLDNISLSFNINETYDYIGRDAALQNLDIMSAISDMQKDQVLQQYQYFVEPKPMEDSVVARTMDGMVVRK